MAILGIDIIALFIISLISSLGLSILLVEKNEDWPVIWVVIPLKKVLSFFHSKFAEVLDCTICTSFWTALFTDISIFYITGGSYFLWPLTGFAASGISWLVLELLAILDGNE